MASLKEDKKLVWLGFKNPQQDTSQVQTEMQKLKDEVGDFETFKSNLDAYDLDGDGTDEDISSYSDFKTYLLDHNFSSGEADAFIDKIKNNFSSYQAFEDHVQNEATSYEEVKVEFGSGTGLTGEQETEEGGIAAGIEIHDEQAISKDGVSLPPGTVEVFANRIEFSESDPVETSEAIMSYSNLAISNQTPNKYETITIAADVENIGAVSGDAYPQLKIDGQVEKAKGPISLLNGESTTVSFDYTFTELVSADVTIATLEPKTVSVVPEGLI